MGRFALAALAFAALALGTNESRTATAQPGGFLPASELVEVQYRPYRYRQERRADRRAWRRERERQVVRRAYRAGRRDAHYGRGRY
ncbi:MAG: hypothetical protein ICV73_30475 [Acetobacteraceae bacterium]|nr:hypothetical protein [Acetobacteraceae bacterium]